MADAEMDDAPEHVNSSEWKNCIAAVARAVVVLKARLQPRSSAVCGFRAMKSWQLSSLPAHCALRFVPAQP